MKPLRTKRKKGRSGTVLPLAVLTLLILFILGMALLRLGFSSRLISVVKAAEISARAAADAGLAEAMHQMNEKLAAQPWDNTLLPSAVNVQLPGSGATYSYNVTGSLLSDFTITSTGQAGRAAKTVNALTYAQLVWFGIGVKEDVTIKSKTTFGTYPPTADYDVSIRTNSEEENAINLFPNTYIPGDVIVGPAGNPDEVINAKTTSVIGGDTYAGEKIDYPDVNEPENMTLGTFTPDANGDVTISGSGVRYQFPSMNIAQGKKLFIEGYVTLYVTGGFRIHQAGELVVKPDSSLVLYLGDSFIADQDSFITNMTLDATNLKIYGTNTCTSIQLKNSGDFWGAIYAPYADLLIYNSGSVYGSFIGNSLDMKNSGQFYFDTRLLDDDLNSEPAFFEIERFWEG